MLFLFKFIQYLDTHLIIYYKFNSNICTLFIDKYIYFTNKIQVKGKINKLVEQLVSRVLNLLTNHCFAKVFFFLFSLGQKDARLISFYRLSKYNLIFEGKRMWTFSTLFLEFYCPFFYPKLKNSRSEQVQMENSLLNMLTGATEWCFYDKYLI